MSELLDQQHGLVTAANIQQKDTTFTKIFVGGLPYHTTDKSLRQFFEAFGDIEEAVVITDRQTGKSRGYGFVTMADRESAERAVKEANPIIDGRKANVNLAYLGAKPRINAQNDLLLSGFPSPLRTTYPLMIPSQYGSLPPHYLYQSHYLPAPAGLVMPAPAPGGPLSPASSFYADYGYPPAAPYANGLDAAGGYLAAHHHQAPPPYLSPAAAYAYALQPPSGGGGAPPAHFPLPAYAGQPQDVRMQ